MRRVVAGALAVVAVIALGGCGSIQARKERADRIIDSVDKAAAAGSAQMAVTQKVQLRLNRTQQMAAGGGVSSAAAAVGPPPTFSAQADLGHDRVAYLAPDATGAPVALRIYAGTTIYARRIERPGASVTSTQRPWVRLDLTSVDPDEIVNDNVILADVVSQLQQIQGIENPLFLLKLLRGALSGSVEDLGEDDVRGVRTRHYKLNIDREKAVKDDDEDVQDAYEVIFKSMFATRTVFPGEVWLDDQGLPRRYSVTLKSKVRRQPLADYRITVELFDVGRPVQISLPGKGETARVEDLGSLTQTVIGGGG